MSMLDKVMAAKPKHEVKLADGNKMGKQIFIQALEKEASEILSPEKSERRRPNHKEKIVVSV